MSRRRRMTRAQRSELYASLAGALLIVASVAALAAWFHLARSAGAL